MAPGQVCDWWSSIRWYRWRENGAESLGTSGGNMGKLSQGRGGGQETANVRIRTTVTTTIKYIYATFKENPSLPLTLTRVLLVPSPNTTQDYGDELEMWQDRITAEHCIHSKICSIKNQSSQCKMCSRQTPTPQNLLTLKAWLVSMSSRCSLLDFLPISMTRVSQLFPRQFTVRQQILATLRQCPWFTVDTL